MLETCYQSPLGGGRKNPMFFWLEQGWWEPRDPEPVRMRGCRASQCSKLHSWWPQLQGAYPGQKTSCCSCRKGPRWNNRHQEPTGNDPKVKRGVQPGRQWVTWMSRQFPASSLGVLPGGCWLCVDVWCEVLLAPVGLRAPPQHK